MSLEIREIHVNDLRIGMYVCKLDRDWLETPFLLQGFYIESREDADVVAQYCQHVFIDARLTNKQMEQAAESRRSSPSFVIPDEKIFAPEVPIEDEHKRIKGVFREARSLTKTLLDDIRLGGAINTEAARQTVNDCVNSVIRHPDALVWMSKMRNENEYTAEHCLNVCILAVAFGRHLGMCEEDLQNLGFCGLLHDVGKMKIPPSILNKPSALTEREMRIMMAHTVHGRNLLLSNGAVYAGAVDVAFSHHERIDGTGYPRRLEADSITRFSKIISIVDAYDAMTADRCYQEARTSTEALKIIYSERGKHFDDHLALKFLQMVGLYPAGSIVELHNGQVGMVIEANPRYRHLPRIMLLLDENKQLLEKEKPLDLSLVEKGDIDKEYLIKHVLKDKSYGISLKNYLARGLFLQS